MNLSFAVITVTKTAQNTDIFVEECRFISCSTSLNGGAISVSNMRNVILNGCIFHRCSAQKWGGGVYCEIYSQKFELKRACAFECHSGVNGHDGQFGVGKSGNMFEMKSITVCRCYSNKLQGDNPIYGSGQYGDSSNNNFSANYVFNSDGSNSFHISFVQQNNNRYYNIVGNNGALNAIKIFGTYTKMTSEFFNIINNSMTSQAVNFTKYCTISYFIFKGSGSVSTTYLTCKDCSINQNSIPTLGIIHLNTHECYGTVIMTKSIRSINLQVFLFSYLCLYL